MATAMATDPTSTSRPWWGTYTIPHGQIGLWRVGPMSLWIQRLPGEWRLAYRIDETALEAAATVEIPTADCDLLSMPKVTRFGVADESESITITPTLADRPVVSSPEKPFYIPAGQTVTVYVGSPLWLRITAGTAGLELIEMPIVRPSDTWFGPNTYEGELCYASRTTSRVRLDELQPQPHRAFTAIEVNNRATTALLLERIKLPVIYLPLYATDSGILWTRNLQFDFTSEGELAGIRYGATLPAEIKGGALISPPRQPLDNNLAMRVFASLFGN